jgi:hypothetical protein
MSGTLVDPTAMEAWLDAKFDRMFAQLTTITNRLNSHAQRMARIETSKPDAGKGVGVAEDQDGGDDTHRQDTDVDAYDLECDRAWNEYRERALRERGRLTGSGPCSIATTATTETATIGADAATTHAVDAVSSVAMDVMTATLATLAVATAAMDEVATTTTVVEADSSIATESSIGRPKSPFPPSTASLIL